MGVQIPDIRAILEALPHRYPLLLVDRVLELEPPERVVALKNVSINEEVFQGHFPGNPVLPGVLILESLAQAAGLLLVASEQAGSDAKPYLVGVDKARFRRPVVPGDQLRLELELLAARRGYYRFDASASVAGERAAEAQLLLSVVPGAGSER